MRTYTEILLRVPEKTRVMMMVEEEDDGEEGGVGWITITAVSRL